MVRSRGGRGEHRMDPRDVEGDGTVRFGRRLRELSRGGTRRGSGTGSGRVRPGEVRAARRPQTEVRSAELVPDEPEHSAVMASARWVRSLSKDQVAVPELVPPV